MLSHGADVHQRSFEGKTPLQVVGAYDVLEDDAVMVVDQLLDAGANVNAKYSYGHTPISLYCFDSHVEIARVLLERGADVLVPDGQGWLPLYWTIYDGSALVLELYLAHMSWDMSVLVDEGVDIIHFMAERCIVEQVLDAVLAKADMSKLDPNARDAQGRTAADVLEERHVSA
jgi:ankyrin repeat protein